jgi:hypothetical protein
LTIKEGAVWQQVTDGTFTENAWTQMDPSNLILDGGTFRRSGESPAGDGGGLVLFGSYRDDSNFATLAAPAEINVEIKNGGRLENTGQLWFGADDEHSAGTEVTFTINDGDIDLTGGTIPVTNSTLAVDADLAFFFDYDEANGVPKNEQWEINFTGPGSITVDSAGINVYRQDEFSIWTGGDPVSYEDLWDQGILKANGLSGATQTPAVFSTFFTTSGTPGMDNYVLNSLITAAPVDLPGDYNNNGTVDAADYVVWRNGDSPDDTQAGYNLWKANFGRTAGAGAGGAGGLAAVPEPATCVMLLVGMVAILGRRRA